MYEHLQEEKLDSLQDDLVTCIEGEEGQGGRSDLVQTWVGLVLGWVQLLFFLLYSNINIAKLKMSLS